MALAAKKKDELTPSVSASRQPLADFTIPPFICKRRLRHRAHDRTELAADTLFNIDGTTYMYPFELTFVPSAITLFGKPARSKDRPCSSRDEFLSLP
jgi:hypothetical protein